MSLAQISPAEYEDFRMFLEKACGILLGDNKQYLIQSRLGKMVAEDEIASLADLSNRLRREAGGTLREKVIEAMTTNETLWFRDSHPFEIFSEKVLPELVKQGKNSPRVWSAACSTGQEPYSISIKVQDYLSTRPGSLRDVQIVATDISPAVLEDAKKGFYDELAVTRGLPANVIERHFIKEHWQGADRWQVREEIRKRVRFTHVNLLQSYNTLGRFDVIYCRNVLIYFSSESKIDILARMSEILNPGGYLFLGASESINRYSDAFETVRHAAGVVYQKRS